MNKFAETVLHNGRDETIRHRPRTGRRRGPRATYSNLAIISHSTSEFIIDFATVLPGVQKARVKSRIILTPEHAKRLLRSLQENIVRYESNVGKIEIPSPQPTPDAGPKMGQA